MIAINQRKGYTLKIFANKNHRYLPPIILDYRHILQYYEVFALSLGLIRRLL